MSGGATTLMGDGIVEIVRTVTGGNTLYQS
jgi:hypothetical protein